MNSIDSIGREARVQVFVRLLFCFSLCLWFLSPLPAFAKAKLVVPVYFATDRTLDLNADNLEYTDVQLADPQLNYGVKNIVVESADCSAAGSERSAGLGWWCILDDKTAVPPVQNITLTKESLVSKLKEIVDAGPTNRPLVVFVHGCCNNYDGTMNLAAEVASGFEAPLVTYCWSSVPPLEKYRDNEPRARATVHRFQTFLRDLETTIGPNRIILIGYSMGNRLLAEALSQRFYDFGSNNAHEKFRSANFMCADVALNDFIVDEDHVAYNSLSTYISKNNTDPALTASNVTHGFYIRIGAPLYRQPLLMKTDHASLVDIEKIRQYSHKFPTEGAAQLNRRDDATYRPIYELVANEPHYIILKPIHP